MTKACKFYNPYLTLGDSFAQSGINEESDHLLTIGVVGKGNCQDPVLILSQPMNPSEKYHYSYHKKQIFYERTAYFWYLNSTILKESSFWEIRSQNYDLKHGPFQFPNLSRNKTETRIAIVGDMDTSAPAQFTIRDLITQSSNHQLDLFIHVGDFAYNIQDNNGKKGDDFFDKVSPITVNTPYTPIAGNHESLDKSEFLNYRFRLPKSKKGKKETYENSIYSYTYGNALLIFADFDFIFKYFPEKITEINALKKIQKILRNSQSKWKIFLSHRPFYCSEPKAVDCTRNYLVFRRFEVLLKKYKVQLVISGHVHSYLRMRSFHDLMEGEKDGFEQTHLIIGHSGTTHFFTKHEEDIRFRAPFVKKICNMFPSWLDLRIQDDMIIGKLWNSDKNFLADEFKIIEDKTKKIPPKDKKVKKTYLRFKMIVMLLLILLLLVYYKKLKKDKQKENQNKNKPFSEIVSHLDTVELGSYEDSFTE